MMTTYLFVRTLTIVLALMAALSLIETALPFFRKSAWRRGHLVANVTLVSMTVVMNFVLNAGTVSLTAWLNSRHVGLFAATELSPLLMIVVGIAALDACTYAAHRLMHAVPFLWRAHRVHHADPLVDVTTALRFHPIESVWRFACVMIPAWALGLPVEAVAAYRVISVVVGLVEHANVKLWLPLDTAISFALCTPNMHKIHHSRRATETNTNYGNIFSLLDRALGTFTPSNRVTSVHYGLDGYDDVDSQSVRALLRLPFRSGGPLLSASPASRRGRRTGG